MRRIALFLVAALVAPLALAAQATGIYATSSFASWTNRATAAVTAGSATVGVASPSISSTAGVSIPAVFVGQRLKVNDGGVSETVTVSAATCSGGGCTFTATFANAHAGPFQIQTGSAGLDEALEAAELAGGGLVVVPPNSGVTASTITASTIVSSSAAVEVLGSGAPVWYVTNAGATAYVQAGNLGALPVLSGSFTGAATAATIGVAAQTVTVTGVASGDQIELVSAPAPTALCPLTTYRATAANTVSLDFAVLTAAACTPATGTYKFLIVR